MDIVHTKVVLILHIYVIGQVAVEVNGCRGNLGRQRGVVESNDLQLFFTLQLTVDIRQRRPVFVYCPCLFLTDKVCPKRPSYVQVFFLFGHLVGKESVEVFSQKPTNVQQVGINMTQDGIF